MATLTVRLDEKSHQVLRAMAERDRSSMQDVLAKAIEDYRRKSFLEELNTDFAALKRNRSAWKHEQEERAAWDATVGDSKEPR